MATPDHGLRVPKLSGPSWLGIWCCESDVTIGVGLTPEEAIDDWEMTARRTWALSSLRHLEAKVQAAKAALVTL